MNGIDDLIKRDLRQLASLCTLPSEDTMNRWPFAPQEEGGSHLGLPSAQKHES